MEKWLMKLNFDRGDYICNNWSKVKIDNEYGYFARVNRKIGIFIGLDYRVYVVGANGKLPNKKQAINIFTDLIYNDWIKPVQLNNFAPFGDEFENRLPFEIDDEVINLGKGELDCGN